MSGFLDWEPLWSGGVRSSNRSAPNSATSSKGRPRLVLVTCGGPFNQATGHYRDNISVTAVVD
jgi:hypothetical protein